MRPPSRILSPNGCLPSKLDLKRMDLGAGRLRACATSPTSSLSGEDHIKPQRAVASVFTLQAIRAD